MTEATTDDWLILSVEVPATQVEALETLLWSLGAVSVTLMDAADQPIHEPDPGEMPLWPSLTLAALFAAETDRDRLMLALIAADPIESWRSVQFKTLAGRDWTRVWMDRFEPMRFGPDLWICPSHTEPDPGWPVVIRLDPGLAFGSGTHPTTTLCLEWLADYHQDRGRMRGLSVIDYGCGSGVLAIAAALTGADSVLAIDHDPQALVATLDNAERNQVLDRITVALPDQVDEQPADIVLANILAGPLVELAPWLIGLLRPGGQLILSGVLAEQAGCVTAAYSDALELVSREVREEWVRLIFRRNDPHR